MILRAKDNSVLISRNLTWWALGLCLAGLFSPLMQNVSSFEVITVSWAGLPFSFLFGIGGLTLVGIYAIGAYTTHGHRLDWQKPLSQAALALTAVLFLLQCYQLSTEEELGLAMVVPVYFKESGHSLGWGWLFLAAAAIALKVAAGWVAGSYTQNLSTVAGTSRGWSGTRLLQTGAEPVWWYWLALLVLAAGAFALQVVATCSPLTEVVMTLHRPELSRPVYHPVLIWFERYLVPGKLLLLVLAGGCLGGVLICRLRLAASFGIAVLPVTVALGFLQAYLLQHQEQLPFGHLSSWHKIQLAWGWWPLLASVVLLSILSFMASNVKEFSPTNASDSDAIPASMQRNDPEEVPAAQDKSDTGRCSSCQALNSRHATRCHSCGAQLPWSRRMAPKAAKDSEPVKQLPRLDGEFGGKVLVVGGHLLTFWFCSTAPLLGVFLWRYMVSQESRYAVTAWWGWVLGFVMGALILVGRFVDIFL